MIRTVGSGGGTVDFQEFVGGLSAFSSRGGREEKLRCSSICLFVAFALFHVYAVAFKVYDVDRDGYISNGELFLVLKMMVGNNLKVFPSVSSEFALMCACTARTNNCSRSWTRRSWKVIMIGMGNSALRSLQAWFRIRWAIVRWQLSSMF